MVVSKPTDSTARLAAQVELLVLRASLPEGSIVVPDRLLIDPSRHQLTESEAVEVLAGMPKPLRCIAAEKEGALSVSCEQLASGDLARSHELRVNSLDRIGGLGSSYRPTEPGDLVLVAGRNESILLPVSGFQRWYRDYYLTLMLSASEADAQERAHGAVSVIRASRIIEDAELDNRLPPELKGFWRAIRGGWHPHE